MNSSVYAKKSPDLSGHKDVLTDVYTEVLQVLFVTGYNPPDFRWEFGVLHGAKAAGSRIEEKVKQRALPGALK